MGLKFRYKRTRCTGSIRDKPLIEVRWTVEEGACGLEDLIAGDLGLGPQPPVHREQTQPAAPVRPCREDGPSGKDGKAGQDEPPVVVVSSPAPGSALAIRRMAVTARVVRGGGQDREDSGEEPPGLLDTIV